MLLTYGPQPSEKHVGLVSLKLQGSNVPFYIPSVDAKMQHQRVRSPLNTGINSPLMASSASKALDKHLLYMA